MEESRKNVRFQRKTGHISVTVKDRAKVTINQSLIESGIRPFR